MTCAVDMDGDSDLDILVAGQLSRNIVWYTNPLKSGESPRRQPAAPAKAAPRSYDAIDENFDLPM